MLREEWAMAKNNLEQPVIAGEAKPRFLGFRSVAGFIRTEQSLILGLKLLPACRPTRLVEQVQHLAANDRALHITTKVILSAVPPSFGGTESKGVMSIFRAVFDFAHFVRCAQTDSYLLSLPQISTPAFRRGHETRNDISLLMLAFLISFFAQDAFAQESPHGKIRFECSSCHTTDSWKIPKPAFKHEATGFALSGRHSMLRCESCHEGLKFAKKSSNCLSCHTDVHKSELGTNCLRCHTTQTWKITDMVQKHQSTRFPLLGRHSTLSCQTCHANAGQKQFAGTPTDCFSCHRNDFARAKAPNHTAAGFSTNCVQCHQVTAFRWGTGFDHARTAFALTGAHVAASCFSCHKNQVFKTTPTQCVACHQTDFTSTRNPNHQAARFPIDCQSCHTTNAWAGAQFNHDQTQFPLIGAHRNRQCQSCHADNIFAGKPTDCVSCHRLQFNTAQNPNHVSGNFPTQCQTCHNSNAWRPATFNHSASRFPLTGAHQAVACSQCHVNGQYTNTPTTCIGCHQTTFNATTNPNHVQRNFSTNCVQCHTTAGWQPAQFDHATTQFPLTGRHTSTQCQTCHVNNNYQLVYTDCFQCHQPQYLQPTNPRHVEPSFSHNCVPCHTTSVWRPSTFSHNATRFPLTGRHIGRNCNECHVNNIYRNLPGTCWDCHQDDFNGTTDPNHVQRNFSHDCTQCHSTNGWDGAAFDHNTTNFQLTGRHTSTQCQQCHVNGNYQLVYTNCFPCHQTQYNLPASPRHSLPSFAHECTPCHTTTVWRPSTFSHANTPFPLVGAHQSVTCNQCHVNNQYQLPHTCFDCHATNFNTTTNPNHLQGQFSHDCLTCHTQSGWQPASFNHATTNFPLTGRHTSTQCQQCHVNGNYQLVYTNCFPCHQTQYNLPTSPRHALPSFAHECTPCHTTTVWRPSTFSHANTPFPLTGAHQATACNQCHVNNIYQGTPTTCIGCHQSDFNTTTNPNHVARSFSQNCTECHATSAWSPASFNHGNSGFPLTGRHTSTSCVSCHVNNNYNLVYNNCYQCHATQFAQPPNPNHVALQFSHNCTPCHTTTVWRPSTFNHDTQFFKIYSGKHRNRWTNCSECHQTIGQYQNFTCTTACHSRSEMDNDHRDVSGYQYSSPACYTCHRNV